MLTSKDFSDITNTKSILIQAKEDLPKGGFLRCLEILEFVITQSALIMFRKDGKPKTRIELIGSVFQIVSFIRELVRMINGAAIKPKQIERVKGISSGANVAKAVEDGVKRSKKQ